jgi:flagellar biogenesis protein FliO
MSPALVRALPVFLLVLASSSPVGGDVPSPAAPSLTGATDAFALSAGWAAVRLAGSLTVVGALLGVSLAGYRWLARRGGRAAVLRARGRTRPYPRWFSRWMPSAAADADRITIVTRSYVGSRESVCLVEVGHERFLIGVTASAISLLGRLEGAGRDGVVAMPALLPPEADAPAARVSPPGWGIRRAPVEPRDPEAAGPTAADFSQELLRVAAPGTTLSESSIRTALARSRDRLARLGQGGALGA